MKLITRTGPSCNADWDGMVGTGAVRYCAECKQAVHDFSVMSDKEVREVLSDAQKRVCARVLLRPDGTLLLRNSHPKVAKTMSRVSQVARIAMTAAISMGPALTGMPPAKAGPRLFQIQQQPSGFTLTVVDLTGAAVPNARVTIYSENTKSEAQGRTDSNGQLRMSGIANGTYEVRVEDVPGFEAYRQSRVKVIGHAEVRVALLPLSFVGEVVSVSQPNRFHRFISKVKHIF